MKKANLIIDNVNLDLTDEENLYRLKNCLEFAQIEAVKDYNNIKSKNLFEPDKKAKDISVYYFAKIMLNNLGFESTVKEIGT